jgi:hypothetical protein
VDSCCVPVGIRRRSEKELRGGEAFDNLHGSAAKRTSPQRVNGQRGRCGVCYWLIGWLKQPETEWKGLRTPPVGEKAEVADAHEAAREQVEQEAPQELIDGQSHQTFLVAVSGVSPAEGDVAVVKSDQSVVGNGDTMGVGAEIAQHMFRPAKGPFGIDDPVVTEQYPQPGGKSARLHKGQEMPVELECTRLKGGLESGDKLAAEDSAEHLDRKEEGAA